MLKNTGRSKADRDPSGNESTHFTYDEYRSNVKKSSYKDLMIFLSVFVIAILIFLGFAKILSPNVDVEIADKEEYAELDEDRAHGLIDERLKHLQAEDTANTANKEGELFTPELDEAVVLPSKVQKSVNERENEMLNDKSQTEKIAEPAAELKIKTENKEKEDIAKELTEKKQDAKSAPTPKAQSTYRVVVGSYSTEKQAQVAKSIMQDAGLGVSPIIKHIGSSYTLQVGVYSSQEKAQQFVNNLLKNNFPARIAE